MESLKGKIKGWLPESALNGLRNIQDGIRRFPQDVEAYLHPLRQDTMRRLRYFHSRYEGKRCFIVGNGPSLNRTDLTKLRDEYTFGMNRIFLMFEELGFATTFFVSMNDLVIEQSVNDIRNLEIPKFVNWRARKWLEPQDNLYYLYATYAGPIFAKDARHRLWEGATVTYVSLQLAYFFGFSEVILIGVDHSFATKGEPNATIVSEGDDPNHFHPKYFGKGFRWQLPDLETSEFAYSMAKQAYEKAGRRVLDATVGGKLNIFPKVDYESLFK